MLAGIPGARAQTKPLQDMEYDCLVDANAKVKLGAPVPGLIEKIHVDRGDRVKAGELLVELESNVERAQLAIAKSRARNDQPVLAARARVKFTAQAADRIIRLRQANAGAVTALQFDDATAQAEIAEFNLREAELNLEAAALEVERAQSVLNQKHITSPINGVVVERTMEAGEYRNEQSTFLTLAEIDPLRVEVYVPVVYYGKTPPGTVADVTLDAPLNSRHAAKVTVVDQVLDTASGTFGVRLALPNADLKIPAGLRCRIRFRPS
ncbi:efflux RND transporter periplasmic adaptor subunit [Roseixanthobacter liquoris]|uniref:efflux RND transporter periplasmic adaptor subunit n=1 Tax=Roseixanthobacter liquoris TaxID=3119921 RepID=UPI00372985C8